MLVFAIIDKNYLGKLILSVVCILSDRQLFCRLHKSICPPPFLLVSVVSFLIKEIILKTVSIKGWKGRRIWKLTVSLAIVGTL